MATLSSQQVNRTGLNAAFAAAAGGGDEFANTGLQFVAIKNTDAASRTVTFVTQTTVDGLAVADLAVVVAAGATFYVGPFKPTYYNDSGGKLQLTYSAVTNLSVAILELGSV